MNLSSERFDHVWIRLFTTLFLIFGDNFLWLRHCRRPRGKALVQPDGSPVSRMKVRRFGPGPVSWFLSGTGGLVSVRDRCPGFCPDRVSWFLSGTGVLVAVRDHCPGFCPEPVSWSLSDIGVLVSVRDRCLRWTKCSTHVLDGILNPPRCPCARYNFRPP